MNLRNQEITLGELWDNPKSQAVFRKRFPMIMKHPVQGRARSVTLGQLADFMGSWMSQTLIHDVIKDLEKL